MDTERYKARPLPLILAHVLKSAGGGVMKTYSPLLKMKNITSHLEQELKAMKNNTPVLAVF